MIWVHLILELMEAHTETHVETLANNIDITPKFKVLEKHTKLLYRISILFSPVFLAVHLWQKFVPPQCADNCNASRIHFQSPRCSMQYARPPSRGAKHRIVDLYGGKSRASHTLPFTLNYIYISWSINIIYRTYL